MKADASQSFVSTPSPYAPPDPALRELAQLAAPICQAPMAFIAFVDDMRQWFAAAVGFAPSDTPRDQCVGHAPDRPHRTADRHGHRDAIRALRKDPLVTGPAQARFFAGAPLPHRAATSSAAWPWRTACRARSPTRRRTGWRR